MRPVSKNALAWGLIVLLPFAGISCLEREEEITVAEDGTVSIVASFDGDASDFGPPVALPSEPDWEIIEQRTDTTEEGKVRIKLEAQKTIPYGQDLPYSYVSTGKPNYDIDVQFPTEIHVVREGNRTIYEFKRTYVARDYASFNLSASRFWDQELEDRVIENGIFEVSEQDRNDYLEQFTAAFAYHHWRFIDMTVGELVLAGKVSPATYLKISEHVWNYLQDQVTPVRMLGILGKDEEDINDALAGLQGEVRQNILTIVSSYEPYFDASRERASRLRKKLGAEEFNDEEARDVAGNIVDGVVEQAAREAMPTDSILFMTVFSTIFDQLSQRYELTERISAHDFAIRLHMPGTILATNGFKDPHNPSYIDWNFKGEDLRDRSITLRAVSAVDR